MHFSPVHLRACRGETHFQHYPLLQQVRACPSKAVPLLLRRVLGWLVFSCVTFVSSLHREQICVPYRVEALVHHRRLNLCSADRKLNVRIAQAALLVGVGVGKIYRPLKNSMHPTAGRLGLLSSRKRNEERGVRTVEGRRLSCFSYRGHFAEPCVVGAIVVLSAAHYIPMQRMTPPFFVPPCSMYTCVEYGCSSVIYTINLPFR